MEMLRVESKAESKTKIVIIAGPTSSGKSDLGVEIAQEYGGEIISADSRQVYSGLDVGTGKITKSEMKGVVHHLLDVRGPGEKYSAYEFKKDAMRLIDEIVERGKLPIIVGGTGLYIEGLVRDYDFGIEAESSVGLDFLVINLNPERSVIKQKIRKRLLERWNREGLLAEVRGLIKDGVSKQWLLDLGLEYKYTVKFIEGEFGDGKEGEEAFLTKLNTEIWRYAKRQITFIKRWEFANRAAGLGDASKLVRDFLD